MRYTTGDPDGPPARVGISIGDTLASLHGVIGALMSLLRVKTGQGDGQVVDVSLVRERVQPDGKPGARVRPAGPCADPQRRRAAGHRVRRTPIRSRDGRYVVIAGNSDAIFKRLMQVIGRPDLADDPALAQQRRPRPHSAMLDAADHRMDLARRTIDDVLARSNAAEVPAGRIYSVADIVADPALRRARHDPADASCRAARR